MSSIADNIMEKYSLYSPNSSSAKHSHQNINIKDDFTSKVTEESMELEQPSGVKVIFPKQKAVNINNLKLGITPPSSSPCSYIGGYKAGRGGKGNLVKYGLMSHSVPRSMRTSSLTHNLDAIITNPIKVRKDANFGTTLKYKFSIGEDSELISEVPPSSPLEITPKYITTGDLDEFGLPRVPPLKITKWHNERLSRKFQQNAPGNKKLLVQRRQRNYIQGNSDDLRTSSQAARKGESETSSILSYHPGSPHYFKHPQLTITTPASMQSSPRSSYPNFPSFATKRDSIVMNTLENLRKENENMKLAFKEKEKGYKIHIEELEKKLYQITLAVNNMKEINKELLIQISEHERGREISGGNIHKFYQDLIIQDGNREMEKLGDELKESNLIVKDSFNSIQKLMNQNTKLTNQLDRYKEMVHMFKTNTHKEKEFTAAKKNTSSGFLPLQTISDKTESLVSTGNNTFIISGEENLAHIRTFNTAISKETSFEDITLESPRKTFYKSENIGIPIGFEMLLNTVIKLQKTNDLFALINIIHSDAPLILQCKNVTVFLVDEILKREFINHHGNTQTARVDKKLIDIVIKGVNIQPTDPLFSSFETLRHGIKKAKYMCLPIFSQKQVTTKTGVKINLIRMAIQAEDKEQRKGSTLASPITSRLGTSRKNSTKMFFPSASFIMQPEQNVNKSQKIIFSIQDELLFRILCQFVMSTLERIIQGYESRYATSISMKILDFASNALGETNKPNLIKLINSSLPKLFEYQASGIIFYNVPNNYLYTIQTLEIIKYPTKMGITGLALDSKKITHSNEGRDDRLFEAKIDNIGEVKYVKNIVVVPLLGAEQKIVGLLQLLNKKEGIIDYKDLEFLYYLQNILGNIIQNIESFNFALKLINNIQQNIQSTESLIQKNETRQKNDHSSGLELNSSLKDISQIINELITSKKAIFFKETGKITPIHTPSKIPKQVTRLRNMSDDEMEDIPSQENIVVAIPQSGTAPHSRLSFGDGKQKRNSLQIPAQNYGSNLRGSKRKSEDLYKITKQERELAQKKPLLKASPTKSRTKNNMQFTGLKGNVHSGINKIGGASSTPKRPYTINEFGKKSNREKTLVGSSRTDVKSVYEKTVEGIRKGDHKGKFSLPSSILDMLMDPHRTHSIIHRPAPAPKEMIQRMDKYDVYKKSRKREREVESEERIMKECTLIPKVNSPGGYMRSKQTYYQDQNKFRANADRKIKEHHIENAKKDEETQNKYFHPKISKKSENIVKKLITGKDDQQKAYQRLSAFSIEKRIRREIQTSNLHTNPPRMGRIASSCKNLQKPEEKEKTIYRYKTPVPYSSELTLRPNIQKKSKELTRNQPIGDLLHMDAEKRRTKSKSAVNMRDKSEKTIRDSKKVLKTSNTLEYKRFLEEFNRIYEEINGSESRISNKNLREFFHGMRFIESLAEKDEESLLILLTRILSDGVNMNNLISKNNLLTALTSIMNLSMPGMGADLQAAEMHLVWQANEEAKKPRPSPKKVFNKIQGRVKKSNNIVGNKDNKDKDNKDNKDNKRKGHTMSPGELKDIKGDIIKNKSESKYKSPIANRSKTPNTQKHTHISPLSSPTNSPPHSPRSVTSKGISSHTPSVGNLSDLLSTAQKGNYNANEILEMLYIGRMVEGKLVVNQEESLRLHNLFKIFYQNRKKLSSGTERKVGMAAAIENNNTVNYFKPSIDHKSRSIAEKQTINIDKGSSQCNSRRVSQTTIPHAEILLKKGMDYKCKLHEKKMEISIGEMKGCNFHPKINEDRQREGAFGVVVPHRSGATPKTDVYLSDVITKRSNGDISFASRPATSPPRSTMVSPTNRVGVQRRCEELYEHHRMFLHRHNKSSAEIEYEKSKEECTFKPCLVKKTIHQRSKSTVPISFIEDPRIAEKEGERDKKDIKTPNNSSLTSKNIIGKPKMSVPNIGGMPQQSDVSYQLEKQRGNSITPTSMFAKTRTSRCSLLPFSMTSGLFKTDSLGSTIGSTQQRYGNMVMGASTKGSSTKKQYYSTSDQHKLISPKSSGTIPLINCINSISRSGVSSPSKEGTNEQLNIITDGKGLESPQPPKALLKVDINIGHSQMKTLTVYQDDSLDYVIHHFAAQHKLKNAAKEKLKEVLIQEYRMATGDTQQSS